MSFTVSSLPTRPQTLVARRALAQPVGVRINSGKRLAVTVNTRNFKTSDTQRKLQSATDPDELNLKAQEIGTQISEWWERTDEKPAVVATGVIGFVILWATSGLVDRLDKLPFVGGFFELVGLLVTGWFTYRYLTFAPDREEFKKTISNFYDKVTGDRL